MQPHNHNDNLKRLHRRKKKSAKAKEQKELINEEIFNQLKENSFKKKKLFIRRKDKTIKFKDIFIYTYIENGYQNGFVLQNYLLDRQRSLRYGKYKIFKENTLETEKVVLTEIKKL